MLSPRIFVFILIVFAACGDSESSFPIEEQATVRDSVYATLTRYNEEISEKGVLAEFDYLDSSAEFSWVPPGYTQPIGFDSVSAMLRRNAAAFKLIQSTLDSLHVTPLDATHATYTALIKSTIVDTANTTTESQLLETGTVVLRNGRWKLLNGNTKVLSQH